MKKILATIALALMGTITTMAQEVYEWQKYGAGFTLPAGANINENGDQMLTFSGAGIDEGQFLPLSYTQVSSTDVETYAKALAFQVMGMDNRQGKYLVDKINIKNATGACVVNGGIQDEGPMMCVLYVNDKTRKAFCLTEKFKGDNVKAAIKVLMSVYFKD